MSFAKEILPNIWLGTKNALRDRPFRERNHIIRDVIVDSSFSTSVEPILTSQTAEVVRIIMNGNENQVQIQEIANKVFPILDDVLQKDRGLLLSGESWNSPQMQLLGLWCAKRGEIDFKISMTKIQTYL